MYSLAEAKASKQLLGEGNISKFLYSCILSFILGDELGDVKGGSVIVILNLDSEVAACASARRRKNNLLTNDITEIMETTLVIIFVVVGIIGAFGVVGTLDVLIGVVGNVSNVGFVGKFGSNVGNDGIAGGMVGKFGSNFGSNVGNGDIITTIGIRCVVNLGLEVTDEGDLAGINHIADACSQTGDSPSFVIKSGLDRDSAGEVVLIEDFLELVLLKINIQITVADLFVKVVVFKGVCNIMISIIVTRFCGVVVITTLSLSLLFSIVLRVASRLEEAGNLLGREEARAEELRNHLFDVKEGAKTELGLGIRLSTELDGMHGCN